MDFVLVLIHIIEYFLQMIDVNRRKVLINHVLMAYNVKIPSTVLMETVPVFLHITKSLIKTNVKRRKDLINHVLRTQNVKIPWTVVLDIVLVPLNLHITESIFPIDVNRRKDLVNHVLRGTRYVNLP